MFIASLLKDYLPDKKLTKRVIPKLGQQWLERYAELQEAFKSHCQNPQTPTTVLEKIIHNAESKLAQKG